MDRTERFYKMDQLLHERRSVPINVFLQELSVSPATFKRDLEYFRSRFQAPVVWDRNLRGYRYSEDGSSGSNFVLPGLWFREQEIHALMIIDKLLADLQPGILQQHLAPLRTRLSVLIGSGRTPAAEVRRRIRILHPAFRRVETSHFEAVSSATLSRHRLRITYYSRPRGSESVRVVSPQRLTHYRGNWYLEAWCHLRQGLRRFAVDAIRSATVMRKPAREVTEEILDAKLGHSYGVFSGRVRYRAVLRFSPLAARWVAREQWHPEQRQYFDTQGRLVLEVPYSKDQELVMDILRHGAGVEVLRPAHLRQRVQQSLAQAAGIYTAIATGSARE